jgi:DNA-binding beta-propeller fold protein YncE
VPSRCRPLPRILEPATLLEQLVAAQLDILEAVLDVTRLQRSDDKPVLAALSHLDGAIYAAISPDDRFLFISEEDARRISVFDLARARAGGDGALIGHIPVGIAPVGLAFSPDGQWLYATSEQGATGGPTCKPEQGRGPAQPQGLLFRIDAAKAGTDPAHSVVGAIPAGCAPVRVAVSASGKQIWVTARGDDAVLRIQADEWLAAGSHPSVEGFRLGPSPVGIAVRPDGKQLWVALSSRFDRHGIGQLARLRLDEGGGVRMATQAATGFPREVTFLPDGRTLAATLFDAAQVVLVPTTEE